MRNQKWVRLLAYVTGAVYQELLVQNEYLAAENLFLRAKLPSTLRLSDPERVTPADIGKSLCLSGLCRAHIHEKCQLYKAGNALSHLAGHHHVCVGSTTP